MGSGKSSVGRALSTLLCTHFIDLDEYITTKSGKSIPEIFDAGGEEGFRALEAEALREVLATGGDTDLVLSLGGGTILREENAALIARCCRCVFLRASAETLRSRLEGESEGRPMLRDGGFGTLLAARTPAYEQAAGIIIDTDGLTPMAIAHIIAEGNKL